MTYVLAFGSILCGWAVLTVMSSERARLWQEWEANKPADPPAAPASPPPTDLGKPRPRS